MSKDVIDEFVARTGYEGLQADMDEAVEQCPGENVYRADSIKELAELQGLDAAALEGNRRTLQRAVRQGGRRGLQQDG